MTPGISSRDIIRRRLRSQSILSPLDGTPAETVRRMLAIQAQDFASACWAIGSRTRNSTMVSVNQSLSSGAVVRSWPMRGTLHFVAAEDLRWLLSITEKRMLASVASRQRQLELDDATLDRAQQIVREQLSGGRTLARDEAMAAFAKGGIVTSGQRGYHLLYHLAQTGVVCWGPTNKNQQALVLVDEWIPRTPELDRDEALGRYLTRYLAGHGPATLADFQWWSKLTKADARLAASVAGASIVECTADGQRYWMTPEDAEPVASLQASDDIIALPGFDEYLLGYQDRSLVLAPEHAPLITPGSNGIFLSIIVCRGSVVGTWRRTSTAAGVTVAPMWFAPPPATWQSRFTTAIRRYGRFLGVPVSVQPATNGHGA